MLQSDAGSFVLLPIPEHQAKLPAGARQRCTSSLNTCTIVGFHGSRYATSEACSPPSMGGWMHFPCKIPAITRITRMSTSTEICGAVVNVIHKESHFTTHVYLTAYRAMHYGAVLNRPALNVPVYAAITKQLSGCIIQTATCLLITEKHIFMDWFFFFQQLETGELLLRRNLNISICFTHAAGRLRTRTYTHPCGTHAIHGREHTHTHTRTHILPSPRGRRAH